MADKIVTDKRLPDDGERQYLISSLSGNAAARAGIQPLSVNLLNATVNSLPGVKVIRVIKPGGGLGAFAAAAGGENAPAEDVFVAQIGEQQAQMLKQSAPPNIIIEQDLYLRHSMPAQTVDTAALNGAWSSQIPPRSIKFRVIGEGDKPLSGANVTLQGYGFPDQGSTNNNGEVTLNLYALVGRPAQSLFVLPRSNYWNRIIHNPPLSENDVNIIRVKSLQETISHFPNDYKYGWGAKIMGLDKLDERLTGKGIKIAIIDSGADNNHPLLNHIQNGRDFTDTANPSGWTNDIVGHGTHCAGTITAFNSNGTSLRGFAPEAEIHIFKIFPGGQFSTLIDALNECITRGIDVVNMSLGSPDPSITISQTLEKCALNGIACIVAAGNSGGDIAFPAVDPHVLSVSAIGNIGEVPPYTWDYETAIQNLITREGIFSPNFTCFGPSLGVCAPGVGIISTAPGGAFQAESGTSMAAPHVTGVAALLLAHHPLFKTTLAQRTSERVAGLFNLIRSLCIPFPFPNRAGAGMPTVNGLNQLATAGGDRQAAPQLAPQGFFDDPLGTHMFSGAAGFYRSPPLSQFVPFQAGPQQLAPQTATNNFLGMTPYGMSPFISPSGVSPFLSNTYLPPNLVTELILRSLLR